MAGVLFAVLAQWWVGHVSAQDMADSEQISQLVGRQPLGRVLVSTYSSPWVIPGVTVTKNAQGLVVQFPQPNGTPAVLARTGLKAGDRLVVEAKATLETVPGVSPQTGGTIVGPNGPAGASNQVVAEMGIGKLAGFEGPVGCLVGVFVNDDPWESGNRVRAMPNPKFMGWKIPNLGEPARPPVHEVFYIGEGKYASGGESFEIEVPPKATSLYLGVLNNHSSGAGLVAGTYAVELFQVVPMTTDAPSVASRTVSLVEGLLAGVGLALGLALFMLSFSLQSGAMSEL